MTQELTISFYIIIIIVVDTQSKYDA